MLRIRGGDDLLGEDEPKEPVLREDEVGGKNCCIDGSIGDETGGWYEDRSR